MNNTGKSNEQRWVYDEDQAKMGKAISSILMNLGSKDERLKALRYMGFIPPVDALKIVYDIGLQYEDYETCEAIIDYCAGMGIKLTVK